MPPPQTNVTVTLPNLFQGNLSDLGKLLMQGSFNVWTDHKKGHNKVGSFHYAAPMQISAHETRYQPSLCLAASCPTPQRSFWFLWFQVKDLARFKPMQRHLFLYDKMLLFCKKRDETADGHEKSPSYSFKHSLKVRPIIWNVVRPRRVQRGSRLNKSVQRRPCWGKQKQATKRGR